MASLYSEEQFDVIRIVSLIASATEIVHALGLGDDLVGRSHECDWPASVRQLPVCTEPAIDVHGTSLEIDQRVRARVQNALSVYRVHDDLLRSLRPDVILTQSHCEVCAVSDKDLVAALGDWPWPKPRVVSLEPNCLDDVWRGFLEIAAALEVEVTGRQLVERLQGRIAAIAAKANVLSGRPNVACLEWLEPLMSAGNWVPELVELAGANCLFGVAGKHSPTMSWQELHQSDPDVIISMPCGFDLERTLSEMRCLARLEGWNELTAVRQKRVFVTDGNQFFNRPGPRLVESLEILAETIHSGSFQFGHEGVGWMKA